MLLLGCLALCACASTPQLPEPLKPLPLVKPSECVSPQLPDTQLIDERFDALLLDEQVAMLANAWVVNERRRHSAEAILARCGDWIRKAE